MAQRILGLDVGAHSVTVAILESTLRSTKATTLDSEAVKVVSATSVAQTDDTEETRQISTDNQEASLRDAQKEALIRLKERGSLDADHVVAAVPGDQVFTRILNFPFSDDKRIKQVIGFELENYIPHDIDDVIIDYHTLSSSTEGATVFAAAVPRAALDNFIDLLGEVDIAPRIISLGTFAYTKLIEAAHAQDLTSKTKPCFAVVDVGSTRTDITVTRDGKLTFARTIRRGADHVIRHVSNKLGLSFDQARRALVTQGRILSDSERKTVEATQLEELAAQNTQLSDAISEGLVPILRDINQTVRSHERMNDTAVEQLFLSGGFANLRGFPEAVDRALEIPTELFQDLPGRVAQKMLSPAESVAYAEAIGLALELVRGGSRESVNFRRGSYSYQGDFQFLVERSPVLFLCFSLILGMSIALFTTQKTALTQQRDRLQETLGSLTEQVLGKNMDDAEQAERAMKIKPNTKFKKALPKFSSIWVMRQVSAAVHEVRNTPPPPGQSPPVAPPSDPDDPDFEKKVSGSGSFFDVEIERFSHLGGPKGELRGQANSLEARALFVKLLGAKQCFTNLEPKSDEVIRFSRHQGWRKFVLNFDLNCKVKERKEPDAPASPGRSGADEAAGKTKVKKKAKPPQDTQDSIRPTPAVTPRPKPSLPPPGGPGRLPERGEQ